MCCLGHPSSIRHPWIREVTAKSCAVHLQRLSSRRQHGDRSLVQTRVAHPPRTQSSIPADSCTKLCTSWLCLTATTTSVLRPATLANQQSLLSHTQTLLPRKNATNICLFHTPSQSGITSHPTPEKQHPSTGFTNYRVTRVDSASPAFSNQARICLVLIGL